MLEVIHEKQACRLRHTKSLERGGTKAMGRTVRSKHRGITWVEGRTLRNQYHSLYPQARMRLFTHRFVYDVGLVERALG